MIDYKKQNKALKKLIEIKDDQINCYKINAERYLKSYDDLSKVWSDNKLKIIDLTDFDYNLILEGLEYRRYEILENLKSLEYDFNYYRFDNNQSENIDRLQQQISKLRSEDRLYCKVITIINKKINPNSGFFQEE